MRVFKTSRRSLQILIDNNPVPNASTSLSTQRFFITHRPLSAKKSPNDQPVFYKQLKQEERRTFSRKRKRFDYESNYSCALALPYSDATLKSIWDDEATLLLLCKKHIIEHASRRIDLFFYALIAYYKTSILPIEGHTNLQHGIGRNIHLNGTEACHSSFTPSLLDQTIFNNEGYDVKYKSLLSGTHLLDNLNATVELPPFVNAFDDVLESICRPKCMAILREVSVAKITPIEGLINFLRMMDTILQDFKQQSLREHYSSLTHPDLSGHPYVNPKLIELVIQGSLDIPYDNGSDTVNELYIQLLLRMTAEEITMAQQNSKVKEKTYLKKIITIQSEILETRDQDMSCAI